MKEEQQDRIIVEAAAPEARPRQLKIDELEPYEGREKLPRGSFKQIEQRDTTGTRVLGYRREVKKGRPQYYLTRHVGQEATTWDVVEIRDCGFKVSTRGVMRLKEPRRGFLKNANPEQRERFRNDEPNLKRLRRRLPIVEF